jgi:pyridoxal phosphate enzyme (YggS family)
MPDPAALRARVAEVRNRIQRAAARAGRDPSHVRLVAVSKTVSAEDVRIVAETGQLDFGENKVQEAEAKRLQTSDLPLRWHLVGHLQSNKARKAAVEFDVIHSVHDPVLVRKLDAAAKESGRRVELLVQVDLAREPTKHGAREDELEVIFEAGKVSRAATLSGLMLLPPWTADPEGSRPWFRQLRAVRDRLLAHGVAPSMLRELSMGMSHDFEVAIEEGATFVRIGTAIFGSRSDR